MIPSDTGKSLRLRGLVLPVVLVLGMFLNYRWLIMAEAGDNGATGLETLPPGLALTTVTLGPLKGLLANALWWRIIEQQDEGNYFETMQLAEWITTLQPRHAKVWTFQAWNLAYNVAYEFPDGQSKWRWIENAITLLTHDALRYNPDNPEIRNELARLFHDRVGSTVDPGAETFKRSWAHLVMRFLPNGDRGDIEEIVSVPATHDALLAEPSVRAVVDAGGALGLDLLSRSVFYGFKQWSEQQIGQIKENPTHRSALRMLHVYHTGRSLREHLRLDPERMLRIDREFGPFDWRLHHAHVVYWAATGDFQDYLEGEVNAQPLIRQSMERSFLNGKLLYRPEVGVFLTTNNFEIIGKLHDYYDYLMEHHYSPEVNDMHRRFLERAGAILYTFNRIKAAEAVFRHYQEDYLEDGLDFQTWMARNIYRSLHTQTFSTKQSLIESSLFQAYNWLATGDTQRALGYAKYAKLVWTKHQNRYRGKPSRQLPPFDDIRAAAIRKVLSSDIAETFKQRLMAAAEHPIDDAAEPGGVLYLGDMVEKGLRHTQRPDEQ